MSDMPSLPYNDDFFEIPNEIQLENTEVAEISKKRLSAPKREPLR